MHFGGSLTCGRVGIASYFSYPLSPPPKHAQPTVAVYPLVMAVCLFTATCSRTCVHSAAAGGALVGESHAEHQERGGTRCSWPVFLYYCTPVLPDQRMGELLVGSGGIGGTGRDPPTPRRTVYHGEMVGRLLRASAIRVGGAAVGAAWRMVGQRWAPRDPWWVSGGGSASAGQQRRPRSLTKGQQIRLLTLPLSRGRCVIVGTRVLSSTLLGLTWVEN